MPKYDSTLHHVPRPHSAEFVLETGKQMKAALHFMHNKGYAHCDVKATNIFLDSTGKCGSFLVIVIVYASFRLL
jgi:serine/threonine protein kinase